MSPRSAHHRPWSIPCLYLLGLNLHQKNRKERKLSYYAAYGSRKLSGAPCAQTPPYFLPSWSNVSRPVIHLVRDLPETIRLTRSTGEDILQVPLALSVLFPSMLNRLIRSLTRLLPLAFVDRLCQRAFSLFMSLDAIRRHPLAVSLHLPVFRPGFLHLTHRGTGPVCVAGWARLAVDIMGDDHDGLAGFRTGLSAQPAVPGTVDSDPGDVAAGKSFARARARSSVLQAVFQRHLAHHVAEGLVEGVGQTCRSR